MKLQKELDVAKKLAREAGRILIEMKADAEVNMKGKDDYVTSADFAVSDLFQKKLRAEFPEHGVMDEESQIDERDKDYCWIVDPLDGTWGYVNGYDDYAVLVGLIYEGNPVLGVVYRPVMDELIWAVKGEGAYFDDGTQLKIKDEPGSDILLTMNRENSFFDFLQESGYEPIKMPTSYKINFVARGENTSFLCQDDITMGLWDFCAHQVILEEAGGKMVDFRGRPINYYGPRFHTLGVVASNPKKIGEFLKMVPGFSDFKK